MSHRVLLRFILSAAILFASGLLPAEAQQRQGRQNGQQQGRVARKGKLDGALRDRMDKGDRKAQRVIIRARRGFRKALRRALEIHGDIVEREHPLISGVTAVIHADDVELLENDPAIEGISIDAPVTAFQAPGPPMGGDVAANHLRDTLGLTASSPKGDGIGIAIVDSGIAPHDDLVDGSPTSMISRRAVSQPRRTMDTAMGPTWRGSSPAAACRPRMSLPVSRRTRV